MPRTFDQIVAAQLGQLSFSLLRLQAQVEALTDERDRLVAERDRLLNELAARNSRSNVLIVGH
jgi:phosphodiesterase/alkaline phosphatase D-like protein